MLLMMMIPSVATIAPVAPDSNTVPIREWTVPWEKSRPRDPAVGPGGKIFFVGQVGNYVASLDPNTGAFQKFEIADGTHPHNLVVDPKGIVWYTGNANGTIGRLDPGTGKVTVYPMPDPAVRDPHTLILAPDGNLWFTAQNSNFVGHLNTASGSIRLVKMTTPGAKPYGIVLDEKGRPYFDLFGTNKIGTIDPATMELREYQLPAERTRPRRIARTPDGFIWYGDYSRGFLGRLDVKTGAVKEWANPGGPASLPYAMTSDDTGRLWMVETGIQPNRLVGFDPRTETFFSMTNIPSGGGTVRYMIFDPKTRLIWFGTDANTIGRITVPPAKPTV